MNFLKPKCITCGSTRIIAISGHCVDCFNAQYGKVDYNGYVPEGIGIGGGDDIELRYCLECGQIQDKFPIVEKIVLKQLV